MPDVSFPVAEGVVLTLEWDSENGPSDTVVDAARELSGALATLAAKDRLYGGAWRDQGWMGNLARIMSKVARLRQMLWAAVVMDGKSEPVQDTLQDLINLCVFMKLNIDGNNRWGRA